jgi:hypothetical protein
VPFVAVVQRFLDDAMEESFQERPPQVIDAGPRQRDFPGAQLQDSFPDLQAGGISERWRGAEPVNFCPELLAYLRANGFKTFIVSGGGIEFMRPWVEQAYGIPPEQVVGSSGVVTYELGPDDKPILKKEAKIEFVGDGPGKPVGINRFIGRRPVFAAGNSDGDLQMLQWTTLNDGPRFALIVHHTDAEREFAYDRQSHIGKLDKALDEASKRGWIVVDMKADWTAVHPEPK